MCLNLTVLALFSLAGILSGQPLRFEVASIKPSPPSGSRQITSATKEDPSLVRYTNMPLRAIVQRAYNAKVYQVTGPDILDHTRFEIAAKLPDGASPDQIPEMLRNLLAERFHMRAHRESREVAVYALVAARGGPKKAAEGGAPRPLDMTQPGVLEARGIKIASLIDTLSRMLNRAVIDATGYAGKVDFELHFPSRVAASPAPEATAAAVQSPADMPRQENSLANAVFDAVGRMGLRLQSKRAPVDMLVVDSIDSLPTEN